MSTILDALRKLQRERAAQSPPRDLRGSVTNETPSSPARRRRSRSRWIASLALLLAVGCGLAEKIGVTPTGRPCSSKRTSRGGHPTQVTSMGVKAIAPGARVYSVVATAMEKSVPVSISPWASPPQLSRSAVSKPRQSVETRLKKEAMVDPGRKSAVSGVGCPQV